jgi:hypothetical protein
MTPEMVMTIGSARWRFTILLAAPLLLAALIIGLSGRSVSGGDADQRDDVVVHPEVDRDGGDAGGRGSWMLKTIVGYTRASVREHPRTHRMTSLSCSRSL